MWPYLFKRLFSLIPTLLGVLTLTFLVTQFVPGGPVDHALHQIDQESGAKAGVEGAVDSGGFNYTGRKGIDQKQVEQLRRDYGFDQPIGQRYVSLVTRFLRFDLGESYFRILDPAVTATVLRRLREGSADDQRLAGLTEQERKVLHLLAEGHTNRQIADALYLAEKTVKNYVSNLLAKLGMSRRTEAAVWAARLEERRGPRLSTGGGAEGPGPDRTISPPDGQADRPSWCAMANAPDPSSPRRSPASVTTVVSSVLAVLLGTVGIASLGVVLADDDDTAVGAGGAATATPSVNLTEFAIAPDPIVVGVGGSVSVVNDGSIEHNLAVEGEELRTDNLASGESGTLSLGDLPAGEYSVLCEIPGHADSGMRAAITVSADVTGGAAAGGDTGDHDGHDEMDYQALTDAMLASASAFPAETEGVGGQLLAPTETLADGTVVYDLTMELADWEVEPGRVVEAWTFNGQVPGPMLDLAVGVPVQVRVQNDLPLATDVHWHGINTNAANDGVAPITQPMIEPGDTFTYEFTPNEQMVAMYHPHAHGHQLLPDGMFGVVLAGDVRLPLGQTVGLEEVPADLTISQEIPMVLNDAGVIGYSLNGKSFPATAPYTGQTGDWVLIHYYNEGTQIHPMHLHAFDQIVVAKDGFPLDSPYTVDTLNVAPGERYSVLVNLDEPGTWVWHCHILPHVESEEGMFGMVTAWIVE